MRRYVAVAGTVLALALEATATPAAARQPGLAALPAAAIPCQPVILTFTDVSGGTAPGPYGALQYGLPVAVVGGTARQVISFPGAGTWYLNAEVNGQSTPLLSTPESYTVNPAPPVVPVPSFTESASVVDTGQPVTFDGSGSYETATNGSCQTVQDHQLAAYSWSFGDGTTAPQSTALTSHVFTTPGLYTVILQVSGTDPNAGPAAASHAIIVLSPPPPPPPPPATIALTSGKLKLDRHGRVSVRVRCLRAALACLGKVVLTATRPKPPRGSHPKPTVVATGFFWLGQGRSRLVTLQLSRAALNWVIETGARGLKATLGASAATSGLALTPATSSVRLLNRVTHTHKTTTSQPRHPQPIGRLAP